VGADAFRARTHHLARYARQRLVELLGTTPLVPDDPVWYASMANVPLPAGFPEDLQLRLWREHGIEVPIMRWSSERFNRVSCHLYTRTAHIDHLVQARPHGARVKRALNTALTVGSIATHAGSVHHVAVNCLETIAEACMVKWGAVILIGAVLVSCGFAQNADQAHALAKRVELAPEHRDSVDPLSKLDAEAGARLAGQILLPALPNATAGFQVCGGIVLEHIATSRYDNALTEYRRLIGEPEAKLAARPFHEYRGSDGLTFRDSQTLAQEWLARLPPSILERYQRQVDADAAQLLAEGVAARDPAPLRRLLRDYRASMQANKARAILGDLAFERGDFEQALESWRPLIPLPSRELFNRRAGAPKPIREEVDLTRVHAKQAVALIFAGRAEAEREVAAFRELYPDARGMLAGRRDAYHAILTHWLKKANAADGAVSDPWPTFAGAPTRNRVLGKAPSDRLWLDGATWRVSLPKLDAKEPPPVWLSATRSLAIPPAPFHPVIAEGQVLICDGQSVYSYDLLTGKPLFRAPATGAQSKPAADGPSDLTFSVSTSAGRAFARLGKRPNDPRPGRLVGIDLTPGRAGERVVWTATAEAEEGSDAYFETDPLVVGDHVYVGVVRDKEFEATRLLACFDLAGARLWQVKVADFKGLFQGRPARPSLLAASGSTIVWATNAGALVGLDAWTGRRLWAFLYPTIDGPPAHGVPPQGDSLPVVPSPRGASSCLAADGHVYVAPADSPSLYCLDAETGQSLWERPWTKGPSDIVARPPTVSEIVDLLGVVDDRLIFTDRSRLQALDARTGGKLEWQQPSLGKLPSQGRGLLAGPWVFWPTADPDVSWRAVTAVEGLLRHPETSPPFYELTTLRGLPAGNIAFGDGCLAIAGAQELVVYVPARQQLPQLQRDPQARKQPAKLFRLALAQIESGQPSAAEATIGELERQAPRAELAAWKNLIRERTAPIAVAATPAPVARERKHGPAELPVSVSPRVVGAGKLQATWGPISGVAPPIECSSTAANDVSIVLEGAEIAFVDARTGNELFRRERHVPSVDWLGRQGRTLLVAGRTGVEAFDLELRRPTWRFDAPDLKHARWRLIDDRPRRVSGAGRLGGFQFLNGALTFIVDSGRGFALDPHTGATLAVQGGDEIEALAGSNVFQPAIEWHAAPSARHLQLPSRVWRNEPQPTDFPEARRRLLWLANGSQLRGEAFGAVKLVAADGMPLAIYDPPWPTSLTGGAAHVLGDESLSLALVPRNQGFELVRLARPRLRPMWALPASELRDGFDVRAATWDERALYLVHAGELQARDLSNGAILWRRTLPTSSGEWKVERLGGDLIAWPQSHAGLPALSGPVHPIAAALTLSFGRRGIGAVPILLVDAKDGGIRQRLDVPYDRGPVFVHVNETRLIVSAGGAVRAWSALP
jgi:outer membrane protein assembly factor BamB